MVGYRGKRALDLALATPGLLLSLPVQGAVACLVRWRLGSPVLFRQTRPGLHGEPFEMVKFRTMKPVVPSRGWTDDASRMTRFGAFLRSTSLDELPTLWNVVRGDMSLVGPRPLLTEYLPRYTPDQARRHEARPGLTGLAQTSGRNSLTWEEKFRLDLAYIEKQSLTLDIQLLLRTFRAVKNRDGITAEGYATASEFLGKTRAGLS